LNISVVFFADYVIHESFAIIDFMVQHSRQKKNPFPGKETGTLTHLNSTHEKVWNSKDGERFDTTNSHTFEARG
jgi:hypothetical protein